MDEATRELVRMRARNRCEYGHLRQEHSPLSLQIEHVTPKKHGGGDDPSNLALACDRCNLNKGTNLTGIDPDTNEITVIFNPRTELWDEHFELRDVFLVGRTAVGRTTVNVLCMNEPRRLQLRTVLLQQGELDV